MARRLFRMVLLGLWIAVTVLVIQGTQRLREQRQPSKSVYARDASSNEIFSGNYSFPVSKRALSYTAAVAKGCRNLNIMAGRMAIDQSVFTMANALPDNGWDEATQRHFPTDLQSAFSALGFSTADADNVEFTATQDENGPTTQAYGTPNQPGYVAPNQNFEATYGQYQNVFNTKNGVIIATNNNSPTSVSGANVEQPPLNKYSDVTWLLWQSFNPRPNNLNYYFRYHVEEPNSIPVIDQVLSMTNPPATLSAWPGNVYQMNTDLGKALLGTPNGNGVTFFLAQHRAALGGMYTVTQCNVFATTQSGKTYRNLAFKVAPVS